MTVQRSRRTVPWLLAAVAGVLLTLLSAAPATGHATLIGTDPADGDVLPEAPATVTLRFNESVQVEDDGLRLLDDAGEALPSTAASIDDTVELTPPADLADGTYIVDWQVVSADGHPVGGAFTFTVGDADDVVVAPTDHTDTSSTAVDVLHQAAQIVVYVGILGAAGLVLFRAVLLDPAAEVRLLRPTAQLAAVAVVGLLLLIAADGAWRTGAGPSGLVDPGLLWDTVTSRTGTAAGVGAAGLLVALASERRLLASGGAVLALLSLPLTGHSRSFGPAWLVMGSDLLHVLAAAVWFGGILGLFLTMRAAAAAPATARTVARFSTAAAWLVLALAVTGTLLAWRILPGLGALTTTGYGVTLIAKVAAVAGIVAIAAWNRFRLVARVTDDDAGARSTLRRTVAVEAWILLAVLAVTGVLVSQSPTGTEAASEPAPVTREQPLGEGTAEVEVSPAVAGHNTLEIVLTDADGAPLDPEQLPQVRLTLPDAGLGPLSAEATHTGPGHYEATADIPLPGDWEVELSVRTSTYENPVVVMEVEVGP